MSQFLNQCRGFFLGACLALLTPAASAEIVHINNDELADLLRQGVSIVDVRTLPEWQQTGVVGGSHLVSIVDERGRGDPDGWVQQMNQAVDPSRPVILICRSGNRTLVGARLLSARQPGRTIYNVQSGIGSWIRAGKPVVSMKENLQQAGLSCGPRC